ncbi:hypothetical protein F2Q69_00008022 [Brassica cretica]|uniref:Uncharacterized protein n=1 Tax=Brassica cretica TaxID=69181 RepID=A0A8S9NLY5_BRACR|nr:hypothetical protein F2Q69_00008022 [Brassica cretica]
MYTMATEAIKRVISASVLDFAGTLVLEFSGNRIHGRRWLIGSRGGLCSWEYICVARVRWSGGAWMFMFWGGEVLRSFDG